MTTKSLFDTELSLEIVREKIYIIRGKKVMLDKDLAALYGVKTMRLNEAVRRNISRFPEDFMFQLTSIEMKDWISHFAISNSRIVRSLRKPPLVFTEQGIAMLSSVLHSEKAISVNIQIIRIFTKLREMIDVYKELREKVEEMEKTNTENFNEIFRIIKLLIQEKEQQKNKIGFVQ